MALTYFPLMIHCIKTHGAANLASIYYEQGNLEMAIFHYKQAISLDSEFLEAYNNLVGHLVSYHYTGFFTVNLYFYFRLFLLI
jgi:tetratricopeptide (TPR) repeat protein